ncbi:protein FAR-RED IMPAIRED RESPONSE 1-like [Chenopodium quinoa]|uniref:protein FAR-RED IMPAIRED RESPONSE 1-like n=1 Tax=Chenopodium quinoa TaxID=63459 RepID=UPI000B78F60E|nr:protein FAR-RED IMPAIRED RESPONSE 1-like [Chenopodium quinoa]
MILKRYEDGGYIVSKFEERHTHPMYSHNNAHFQKSKRKLTLLHKKMIIDNSKINIGPVKTFKIMKEYVGGYENIGASKSDFKNFHRDLKAYIEGLDTQMFVDNFKRKTLMWSAYFFYYEMDEDGCLCRALWADPICRKNYVVFGDMVSFDTIYQSNSIIWSWGYSHKKCVTFAVGFIAKKDVVSFQWLCRTFLKAMGHREPNCLITDQDPTMKIAVNSVFEQYFIPAYFRGIFVGGIMRTTSRSESENSFFSSFINPHVSLVEFFMRYETALDAQRHSQAQNDNDSQEKYPRCKTEMLIEMHGSKVYTVSAFYNFQDEVYSAFYSCCVDELRKENGMDIAVVIEANRRRKFKVVFESINYETNMLMEKIL